MVMWWMHKKDMKNDVDISLEDMIIAPMFVMSYNT